MAGFQQLIIVGNVGRSPEMRYLPSGIAVCDFSVAVNRTWTDKDTKEKKSEVDWFKVTCWRGLAETVNQYVTTGKQVMVTGRVKVSAYINKDGEPAASLEVTASEVLFLGTKGDNGQSGPDFNDDVDTSNDLPF